MAESSSACFDTHVSLRDVHVVDAISASRNSKLETTNPVGGFKLLKHNWFVKKSRDVEKAHF